MEDITTLFKEHWDTILITVITITTFFFVFRSKERKKRN